jgi:hypothetical protein
MPSKGRKSSKHKARDSRRRNAGLKNSNRKAEEYTSGSAVSANDFHISKTGWQGVNYNATEEGKKLIAEWKEGTIVKQLTNFHRIPFKGCAFHASTTSFMPSNFFATSSLLTRIRDCQKRLWLVRSFVSQSIKGLLEEFAKQAADLVAEVDEGGEGFNQADFKKNARGRHWYSIFGHDRNNKTVGV